MSLQLFTSPTTPFGRKVMVLILESGLADRVTLAEVSGNPLNPGTLPVDRNPLGKIPALVRGDGPALYDSRVICRYLDSLSGAGLYPDGQRLWDTLVVEATADGLVDAAVLMVYETRMRPEDKRFPEWVEAQWAKVTRSLNALDDRWLDHLAGPLDMGQIAVGCALSYLDFRHGPRDWRAGRPGLAAWEAEFSRRPSMQATRPPAA